MSLNVVIVTRDTLSAVGVMHIMQTSFAATAHIVTDIDTTEETTTDAADYYFTDSETFIHNLHYFLPRKSKTIIVGSCDEQSGDMPFINSHDSESNIIDALNNIFAKNENNDTAQDKLSQRETEVLQLIASGCINKEIADKLNISINTVLTHRKNITSKLGIKSVSGLSFYAMMNGIIAPKH
jgi:DNA-binding CsgD family transcriptional regulator